MQCFLFARWRSYRVNPLFMRRLAESAEYQRGFRHAAQPGCAFLPPQPSAVFSRTDCLKMYRPSRPLSTCCEELLPGHGVNKCWGSCPQLPMDQQVFAHSQSKYYEFYDTHRYLVDPPTTQGFQSGSRIPYTLSIFSERSINREGEIVQQKEAVSSHPGSTTS